MLIEYRLQPILLSRFLINLRQADSPEDSIQASHLSRFSAPNFRVPTLQSIMGNMGESLEYGAEEDEAEEDVAEVCDHLPAASGGEGDAGSFAVQQCNEHGIDEVCGSSICPFKS